MGKEKKGYEAPVEKPKVSYKSAGFSYELWRDGKQIASNSYERKISKPKIIKDLSPQDGDIIKVKSPHRLCDKYQYDLGSLLSV